MNRRKITQDELEVFLRKHKLWLDGDPDGVRADLRGANLSEADLSEANLSEADLRGADLHRADLSEANLSEANLSEADLSEADLRGVYLSEADLRGAYLYGADLRGANLSEADLSEADLRGADLYGADLRGADLHRADLRGADLHRADLRGADLSEAYLYGADLRGVDLSEAKHLDSAIDLNCPIACPEKGSFTAFKKVHGGHIVELEIPKDALRCSATSRKCRCSKAKVISITNLDGTPSGVDIAYSTYDINFAYKVGEIVKVDNFDPNRWNECAPGIHFFITRQEAVNYGIC
jgi:hypothetical protein